MTQEARRQQLNQFLTDFLDRLDDLVPQAFSSFFFIFYSISAVLLGLSFDLAPRVSLG